MKLIKMFSLAAMAALMAMAFAGTGSAMAESTALCEVDPGPGQHEVCPAGQLSTHEHMTGKITVLNSVLNVTCSFLFLGDALSALAAPLVVHGNFTYSGCNGKCTVTEENAPAELQHLKLGHEKADLTMEFQFHVVCPGFLDCRYNGVGLKATETGPLLQFEAKTEAAMSEQTMNKVSGFLCPSTAKLDFNGYALTGPFITE